MPDVVCSVCGGTDFYNEAGFYYCSECQTQTQELREHVFVQQENTFHLKSGTAYVRSNRKTGGRKITSWETFNYIMVGLADEMVNLGANPKFRVICCRLWLMYLTKLEILTKTPGERPKLNACFKNRDAEIVYNRKSKKSKPKSQASSTGDDDGFDEAKLLRKERTKQQKILFKKDYDSNKITDEGLHNRTLESLQSDNESEVGNRNVVNFSAAAKKELLKHMTAEHLKLHMSDLNRTLKCHKINQQIITPSYSQGPGIITRVKLYGILYLALLLTEDKYQLSDLLRFCREGNLSFLDFQHFFPDLYAEAVDEGIYSKGVQCLNTSSNVRKVAGDIFKLLELPECNFHPDLNALCKRYCYELNLPDEICNMALNVIKESNPQFPNPKQRSVPNYEDGKTEVHLSNFAKLINDRKHKKYNNMFVWDDWYSYIERRKSILNLTHFPTKYLLDPEGEEYDHLFINFIFNRFKSKDIEQNNILLMNIARKNLEDLNSLQEMPTDHNIHFPVTMTPFRTYIETLQNSAKIKIGDKDMELDSLKNFSNCTISCLMYPTKFLKLINANDCSIIMGGANNKVEFNKLRSLKVDKSPNIVKEYEKKWESAFGQIKKDNLEFNNLLNKILDKHIENVTQSPVTEVFETKHEDTDISKNESITNSQKRKRKKEHHGECFVYKKIKNSNIEEPIYNVEEKNKEEEIAKAAEQEKLSKDDVYSVHYVPRYDFWINIQDSYYWTHERWEKYFSSMPPNFRWLIEQCSLIVEQKPQELFIEYTMVEAYLTYVHYKNQPVYLKNYSNNLEMIRLAKKAQEVW